MKSGFFTFMLFLASYHVFAAPPLEEGKVLFSSRCAGCHNINKVLTGPALSGVDQRRSIDWIINFVHSSQTLIKKGDKDALAVYEKFNKIPMPDHPDLTDEHIKSIVTYIRSESKSVSEQAPFKRPGKLRPSYTPLSVSNYGIFIAYFAVIALLVAGLLLAVQVKAADRKWRDEQ